MRIRSLTTDDIKQCSKIVGKNYSKEYEKKSFMEIEAKFKNDVIPPQYIVAEEKGEIIGFAGYIQSWMDYNVYNIFWVNVDPKHQRKGIGTKLIEKIIKDIKSYKGTNKAHVILLTTTKPKFYEQFGFKTMFEYEKGSFLMSLRYK